MTRLPRNFPLRLVLASLVLLAGARWAAQECVTLLIPAFRSELTLLESNLTIGALELGTQDGIENLVLTANLAYPLYVDTTAIEPLGWKRGTNGYFRIRLSAQGVLLAPLVMLIAILSWPAASAREMQLRGLTGVPLGAGLVALDTPLDLLGNFRHAVIHHAGLSPSEPLFWWARFLEGGGSAAIALAFAVTAVTLAARMAGPGSPSPAGQAPLRGE